MFFVSMTLFSLLVFTFCQLYFSICMWLLFVCQFDLSFVLYLDTNNLSPDLVLS